MLGLPPLCLELLDRDGLALNAERVTMLDRHAGLVREWNGVCSLVSRQEVDRLVDHVADALSLCRYVRDAGGEEARLVDIGSGGGYPAIPLKVALPELRLTLVERSVKKAGFLRKACAALGLIDAEVVSAEFPRQWVPEEADVITARAVERPDKVVPEICGALAEKAVFLCQSAVPQDVAERFHVERIRDAWSEEGLRRGDLSVIRRVSSGSIGPIGRT